MSREQRHDRLLFGVIWIVLAFALLISIPCAIGWVLYHTALGVIDFIVIAGS